jgi:hypothetical protein
MQPGSPVDESPNAVVGRHRHAQPAQIGGQLFDRPSSQVGRRLVAVGRVWGTSTAKVLIPTARQ